MDIKVNSQTALVFDLDDTLYNEIDYLKSAYLELSKKLEPNSWKTLFSNLFSQYRNKENVFKYVSETYGIAVDELIGSYRNHYPNIKPFDGAIDLINAIKQKEGKIGIITDGRSLTQRNKIRALGITDLIDFIVISGEIGSEKPDEANFRAIEKNLKCTTNYYVGDNIKKDFITPKKIGWKTIGLLDAGLNIHSNAYQYADNIHLPDNFISALTEITII